MLKDKPKYRDFYQIELAEELTGRSRETIRKMMKRKNLSLIEVIKHYGKSKS